MIPFSAKKYSSMNPTNFECPTDISMLITTDYRPSKALYVNVQNNNDFRSFMQQNGDAIRQKNLQNYVQAMFCACEVSPWSNQIIPFDNQRITDFATSNFNSIFQ